MESAYFTPDIEDMSVGCEFEMDDTWGGWKKLTLTKELLANSLVGLGSGNERSPWYHNIRVPYLTKEQIEAEEWKYYQTIPDSIFSKSYVEYYKDVELFKVVISISETSHYLTIEKVFQNVQVGNGLQEFRNTIYNGECKDINTFRKICKLLRI
jgi:hypothetical protein